MSYFKNTNKLLILLVAVLLATNIATVFTIYLHNKELESFDEQIKEKSKERTKRDHGNFMANKLGLSPDQIIIFRELRDEFQSESDSIGNLIRQKRKLLYIELAKEKMNVDTLNIISEEIGDLHGELKKYSVKHFINLRSNCTVEQQQKLFDMFKHKFEKEDNYKRRDFNKSPRHKNKRDQNSNN